MQELSRRSLLLDARQLIYEFLTALARLQEVDRLLLLLDIELNGVFDEAKLEKRAVPVTRKDQRKGVGEILRLALVGDLQEHREGLAIKSYVLSDLSKGVENLLPVKVGEEFSESPDKVVHAPLDLIFLVDNILFEECAV